MIVLGRGKNQTAGIYGSHGDSRRREPVEFL